MKHALPGFALLAALVLGLVSCQMPKAPAVGPDDRIFVFADDTVWNALEPQLISTFEDSVMTPQPELWFTLERKPLQDYDKYAQYKNRLVLGILTSEDSVSRFVQQSIDTTVRGMVEHGQECVFNKYDDKARGQILMFLVGVDIPQLSSYIQNRAPDLLYFFKKVMLDREIASAMSEASYAKKDIGDHLMRDYGWTMLVQHDYWVATDSAQAHFFWVRRANPSDVQRWIFVHWVDAPDPNILTERWVLAERDSVTRQFMRTLDGNAYVEIAPYYLKIENVNFLGRFAYETRGDWRFSDKSGGGPFVNYTLYDEGSRRIYMLDGSIFAPRVEKKALVLQVDALLHTFKTFGDLSKDEQEDVLKERKEEKKK